MSYKTADTIFKIKDAKRLAKIWCELNRKNSPKEFRNIEYDPTVVMNQIRAKISFKECLKEWRRNELQY